MNKKLVLNVIFDPQYLTDGYKKVLLDVYKKKFEKTRLKVCYACHLKALKLQRRAIRNG